MKIKPGIAVSSGVALGPALLLDTEWSHIPRRIVPPEQRELEQQRLHEGLTAAASEARHNQHEAGQRLGTQYGAIFAAHAQMIEDPVLLAEVESLIRGQGLSAEYAFSAVMRRYAQTLENLPGNHFSSRLADLVDVERSVLGRLLNQQQEHLRRLQSPVLLLAHDLTPSQTAGLDPRFIHGFATEAGGRASHTAILAGALGIPAVVGLGSFVSEMSSARTVIVDGNRGLLVLDPDAETLTRYQQERIQQRSYQSTLQQLRDLPAETRDGTRITLMGNIEFPEEAERCWQRGGEGVGLYRTEFLYLDRTTDPTEADHFEAYRQVAESCRHSPVVIRTLDLGADKFASVASPPNERNPFLGLRSLRLCLRNLTLFKTQLRAILRASAFGEVRLLFPMVSTLEELRQAKGILEEVRADLQREEIAFNPHLAVGTMIEVPSAAILSDLLAQEVNFFSIGTNDLVQYTLAADRTNEEVAHLYSPGDPAVLRLIDLVVQAGRKHQIAVSVCGEMSGEPMQALLLVGLGLRQLSLTPQNIPEIKRAIRSVTLAETETLARNVMRMDTARDVNNYLREQANRLLPRSE